MASFSVPQYFFSPLTQHFFVLQILRLSRWRKGLNSFVFLSSWLKLYLGIYYVSFPLFLANVQVLIFCKGQMCQLDECPSHTSTLGSCWHETVESTKQFTSCPSRSPQDICSIPLSWVDWIIWLNIFCRTQLGQRDFFLFSMTNVDMHDHSVGSSVLVLHSKASLLIFPPSEFSNGK